MINKNMVRIHVQQEEAISDRFLMSQTCIRARIYPYTGTGMRTCIGSFTFIDYACMHTSYNGLCLCLYILCVCMRMCICHCVPSHIGFSHLRCMQVPCKLVSPVRLSFYIFVAYFRCMRVCTCKCMYISA